MMGGLRVRHDQHDEVGLAQEFFLADIDGAVGLIRGLSVVVAHRHAKALGPAGNGPTNAAHAHDAQARPMHIDTSELIEGPARPLARADIPLGL